MRHEGPVLAAAFSPDGALVATASSDRTARVWTARVWDAATGEPLGREMRHESLVLSAAVRRDGPDRVLVITAGGNAVLSVGEAQRKNP